MPFDQAGYDISDPVRELSQADLEALAVLRQVLGGMRQRGGWVQHTIGEDGHRCVVGWLMHYAGGRSWPFGFFDNKAVECAAGIASDYLYPVLPQEFQTVKHPSRQAAVIEYNDHWQRRKRDMVRLVKRAIERIEGEVQPP